MQRAQMQQQERQNAYDRFAKSIALGQQQQAMDIQRRQLEAKGTEFDLKSTAQKAAMKLAMGQPISPEETAAIQTFDAFNNQIVFNRYGQPTRPTPVLDTLTGRMQTPVQPAQDLSGLPALEDTPQPMAGQDSFTFQGYDGRDPMMVNQQAAAARAAELGGGNPFAVPYTGGSALPQVPAELPQEAPPRLKVGGELAGTPQGTIMEETANLDLQKEYAKASQQQKLNIQKEQFDKYITDANAIPMLKKMLEYNRKTIDLPYAEALQFGTRFMSPEQADAFDLLQQNRLELAAPLAKQLGVNPTDKDFASTLNRIANLDATKAGRRRQIEGLLNRIYEKNPKLKEAETTQEAPKPARRKYDPATGRLIAQ